MGAFHRFEFDRQKMTYTRDQLVSYENLELAWKRIQTSTDYKYKYLSKKSFDAFSWNIEKNLNLLASEIIERIYEPSRTSKYYLPKKSGLVRPITLLNVKDQIFYQAIINLICQSKLNELKQFRNNHVFGGFNIQEPLSIYFLSNWKDEYKKYQNKIIENFDNGYIWLAKFDLASFYDVIDHKILINIFCKNSLSEDLKEDLYKALEKWTQPQAIDFFHSQGIPQGPCASVILADIYLHLLDEKIIRVALKHDIQYLRYVDDIVLMGKNKQLVERSLIQLDIVARELSLIPQGVKILVKKIENIDDELKGTNSLFEFLEVGNFQKQINTQKPLKKLFLESVKPIGGDAIEILNETNVKFCLYRLLPDPDITDFVLRLIKSYSHLTDLCVIYFKQTKINEIISAQIIEYIKSNPNHDWHTAQLIKLYEFIHDSKTNCLEKIIADLVTNPEKHWILKISLVQAVQNIDSMSFILLDELIKILSKNDIDKTLPYCISLLSANLEIQPEITLEKITNYLIESNISHVPEEFYIFLGYYAKRYDINLENNLKNNRWIKNVLEEHDKSVDGISYGLVTLFDLPQTYMNYVDFRNYFDDEEYKQALHNLAEARGFFESYPESYIQLTDAFNQILLAKIYQKDNITNIKLHELGNMIGKLKNHISAAYTGFDNCHNLRCEIHSVHAYNQSTKQLNKALKNPFQKRDKLKKELAIAYEAILKYIKQNHLS